MILFGLAFCGAIILGIFLGNCICRGIDVVYGSLSEWYKHYSYFKRHPECKDCPDHSWSRRISSACVSCHRQRLERGVLPK